MMIEGLGNGFNFFVGFIRKNQMQVFFNGFFSIAYNVIDKYVNAIRKKVEQPKW
tara:strand:+ start:57 stop:218 length:162 start_codon:yes stop_codon:yes gene_type:complete